MYIVDQCLQNIWSLQSIWATLRHPEHCLTVVLLVTAILSVYGSQILMSINGIWLKNLEIRYCESLLQFENCHWKNYTIEQPTVIIIHFKKNTDWKQREVRVIKENININLPGPTIQLVCYTKVYPKVPGQCS